MAFWKRRSGTFEPSSFGSKHCKYGAYYLGKMQIDGENGLDCTMKPVDNMYKNYKQSNGKNAQRMMVEVTRQGVLLHEKTKSTTKTEQIPNDTLLPVMDISFGTAVPGREKVFALVVRNELSPDSCTWDCHGFLCDSPSVSRDLTLLLVKAFQRASVAGEVSHPMSVDEASRQNKPTTLHILHERGGLAGHRLHRSKSMPAVSTIKVTLNVEYKRRDPSPPYQKAKGKKKEYPDGNKAFAEALAKRDREKDALGLIDKPINTRTRDSTIRPSLRRVESDSTALKNGMAALAAADKENLDIGLHVGPPVAELSECEKDCNDNSVNSSPNGSDSEPQEIVVAVNPLMSILKNPSRSFQEGRVMSISSLNDNSDDDEKSTSQDVSGCGSEEEQDKFPKRAKQKSVRFTTDCAVIP